MLRLYFTVYPSSRYNTDIISLTTYMHLRIVKLIFTSLELPPASAAKLAVQGSPEEMVGSCKHRSIPVHAISPLKIRNIETRLS